MMPRGSVNAWDCGECSATLLAVHVDEGVTPMMLACRPPGCGNGRGMSRFYPPRDSLPLNAVAWEWRKATRTELKRWRRSDPGMFQHCQAGGLVLTPITSDGVAALTEESAP